MALAHGSATEAGASTPSAADAFLAAMESSEWANSGAPAPDHPDGVVLPATATEAVTGHAQVVLGENLNPIHTYRTEHVSTERVLQLLTDMTRISEGTWDNPEIQTMRTKLRETIGAAHAMISGQLPCTPEQRALAKTVGRMLCLAVGQVRDVKDGRGERWLSYFLIAEHYRVAPGLAVGMVRHLVRLYEPVTVGPEAGSVRPVETGHQYGSWADVKRLSAFLRDKYEATVDHPVIQEALWQLAAQLRVDLGRLEVGEGGGYSLAARWSPKATGAGKWLFLPLALMVYPFHQTARTPEQLEAARRKAQTRLRQGLSRLNRLIKTVEVMMSSKEGEWHLIDFGTLPSQALRRHVRAWKNVLKNGKDRFADNPDRQQCAEHYAEHMTKVERGEATVKGARCGPGELVNDARATKGDDGRINGQWDAKMKELPSLGKIRPMIDVSGSMDWAALPGSKIRVMDAAIGIGLAAAEKGEPPFNNKVLSFSGDPRFMTFEPGTPFTERVRRVQGHNMGYSTDFRKACKAELDLAVRANCPPDFFKGFVLLVLSDMQINCSEARWSPDLAAEIKQMYADAGRKCEHGQPFDPPFVAMWNFASTNTMATTEGLVGAASISGYSDAMLKAFESGGVAGLLKMTPGEFLREQLESPRYAPLAAEWEAFI